MGLFLWILLLQTLALAKRSLSENTNTDLTDLKKQLSQLVVKQNEMEKDMKQMRIRNEVMEVQISQLQFAHRQQRWDLYKSNKVLEKHLHEVQQQNNNLRIIISDLRANQKETETTVKLKSTTVSGTQKECCKKEIKPSRHRMIKRFFERTRYPTHYDITNHKSTQANSSLGITLHKDTTKSYLENQKVEDKSIVKDKLKRLLIPATSTPNTSKTVVAFQARPSSHISNVGDNQHLEFDNVIFSEGPEYDKTTGTFQCAIPGVYVFSVTLLTFPNKYLEAMIVRNGAPLSYIYGNGDDRYDSGTNMAVVRLKAGDRVWVRVWGSEHYSGTTLDNSFTTFTGFLLQS